MCSEKRMPTCCPKMLPSMTVQDGSHMDFTSSFHITALLFEHSVSSWWGNSPFQVQTRRSKSRRRRKTKRRKRMTRRRSQAYVLVMKNPCP